NSQGHSGHSGHSTIRDHNYLINIYFSTTAPAHERSARRRSVCQRRCPLWVCPHLQVGRLLAALPLAG
ncbi:unnamed protein product, partial [Musa textilis]